MDATVQPEPSLQPSSKQPLDGNAAAGRLSEVFAVEATTIRATCAGCGAIAVLAEHRAYLDCPGAVLRCRDCGAVVLRVASTPQGVWLDLRGAAVLHVPA